MNNYEISRLHRQWLSQIGLNADDAGKWATKLQNLRGRAKSEGKECELSFEQFVIIAKESGLTKPEQNGCRRGQYHLARLGDSGAYVVGNCRFLPQEENIQERTYNGGTQSMAESLTGRSKHTHQGYATGGLKRSKLFRVVSPDGVVHEGKGMRTFCEKMGLNDNSMAEVCRGIKTQHRGWTGGYV